LKRTILAIMLALALVAIPVSTVLAATSQDVTITATPTFISITNAPASHDFGVVAASGTPNTGETNFTITNDSSVDIDIDIKCDGWDGGANDWTYATPAAPDTGFLYASDGAGGYDIFVQDGIDTELFDAVTPATDPQWGLELNAPTAFNFGNQQQTIVTLTASAAD
jgi:hypothetical protein